MSYRAPRRFRYRVLILDSPVYLLPGEQVKATPWRSDGAFEVFSIAVDAEHHQNFVLRFEIGPFKSRDLSAAIFDPPFEMFLPAPVAIAKDDRIDVFANRTAASDPAVSIPIHIYIRMRRLRRPNRGSSRRHRWTLERLAGVDVDGRNSTTVRPGDRQSTKRFVEISARRADPAKTGKHPKLP